MRKFWDPVIKPLLEAANAARIVEIGADDGAHSLRIARWCRRHDARLELIEPAPRFDVAAFEQEFEGVARVHRALSLEALPGLLPADVVLIDGDHNWYTVFHELRALYGETGALADDAPIAVLHDVGWPYARRDLYYDPETIPEAFRQPYRQGGLRPDSKSLVAGGMNAAGFHAEIEGGPRNGVRTGVQDALSGRTDQVRIVWLDVLFGLAVVAPRTVLDRRPAVSELLDALEPSAQWKMLAAIVEQDRIRGAIASSQLDLMAGFRPMQAGGARSFESSVPPDLARTIQGGILDQFYKGRRMLLHPFDLANCQGLIQELRPGTIFEIGVHEGGRSLWLADQLRALGLGGPVVGIDLQPPADIPDALVRLIKGDAMRLADVLPDELMAGFPRPFLVIEDSAHERESSLAVLEFFDRHLRPGDYIVVEDGVMGLLMQTAPGASLVAGPSVAIGEFLARRGEDYEIDAAYCDRFGYNATGNPNGWLRRR